MATASDILTAKGEHPIHTIASSASVLDAIQTMNRHKIGALVVKDEGAVAGIFTERDVLLRVIGNGAHPAQTLVAQVMTPQVICCGPQTDLDEISAIMKTRRIRHIPVVDTGGNLVGLISIGDVNAHYASNQEQTIHFLSDYIYGRV
jgi:CBS domain-containing protein